MIHLDRSPCNVKHAKCMLVDRLPMVEIKLALPDVDPSALMGVWPDVEKFCQTSGPVELRSKAGARVLLALSDADGGRPYDGQATVVGILSYESNGGVGVLSMTVTVALVDGVDVDPWALLGAIYCSIEPEPDPQQELFT